MKFLIFVKKNDPAIIAALSTLHRQVGRRWDADPIWDLIAVNRSLWLMAKADTSNRAFALPSLSRTMRQIPQKFKDYLTANYPALAWQDGDSILDVLVELTGNEDFGILDD